MAILGLGSSHFLSKRRVKSIVKEAPGNYAFGYLTKTSEGKLVFHTRYVGRSDNDLQKEILQRMKKYPSLDYFRFSHKANTALKAFKKECENYHDFGGKDKLRNKIHPPRPDDYDKDTLPCKEVGCEN